VGAFLAKITGVMMRVKGKVDRNQKEIVDLLRLIGASVAITSGVGSGFPDLVVGWRSRNILIEVKMKKGTFTPDQEAFSQRWRGQYCVVRDPEDLAQALDLPTNYFDNIIPRKK
jgi:hypothetical protein